MHILVWTSLVLLPCNLLGAQDPASQSPPTYAELLTEYNAAQKGWMEEYREASKAEDQATIQELAQNQPTTKFATRFLAASKATEDSEARVDFLTWICSRAYQTPEAKEALATMLDHHIDSPRLVSVIRTVGYIDRTNAEANFERIIEGSSDANVKAQALFDRAEFTSQGSGDPEILAKAKADYQKVIELSTDKYLVTRATGAIFEAEHLAIGMTAPEIDGEDLDHVGFKLSDYRGKVVMIDFWGDW